MTLVERGDEEAEGGGGEIEGLLAGLKAGLAADGEFGDAVELGPEEEGDGGRGGFVEAAGSGEGLECVESGVGQSGGGGAEGGEDTEFIGTLEPVAEAGEGSEGEAFLRLEAFEGMVEDAVGGSFEDGFGEGEEELILIAEVAIGSGV